MIGEPFYPRPPVNVRIRWSNGDIEPVDCVYLGIGEDHCHTWRILPHTVAAPDRIPEGLLIDELPPLTTIIGEIE